MKVFLSSTYEDLIEYRQKAIEILERLGHQVRCMEKFVAQPVEPSEACLSEIEVCELLVGIYAHRYGHIPDGYVESITEAEFRHAKKLNKHLFCFVVDPNYPWPSEMRERKPGRTRLKALKKEIESSLVRDTFTTPDNLASKIASSVAYHLIQRSPLPLPSTRMQIISPSHFGRDDSNRGHFSILLRVKFRNESGHPVLLEYFRIQNAGNWYKPQSHTGNVLLKVSPTKQISEPFHNEKLITESLRIPEMSEIERLAFFILPNPPEPFPGPERLHIIAEATFVQQSPMQIALTLTNQGEIEEVEGIGN
ncbi:MAG: hypothetical protein NPIRA03_32220 [Nitrospirales bacterium]|nr:MAG: hypothetical protein NPIRA03_32220 [Nitrospirales bacterium]